MPLSMAALSIVNKIAFKPAIGHTMVGGHNYWTQGANICQLIRNLERRLTHNKFEFSPCSRRERRIGSKDRIIYISTWTDRLVERWLNDSFNRLLRRWFCPNSYAYRTSDFGLDTCQHHIATSIRKCNHVVKRDVSKYFYTIDHQILLDKLRKIIPDDDPIFELVRQRIQFYYYDEGCTSIQQATVGIPFGSSFACTLANIYLNDLDWHMAELPVHYYRYADDILILARTATESVEAATILDNEIKALKLSTKDSHHLNVVLGTGPGQVASLKHLGLEFCADGRVRLPVEKFRKVINLFKHSFERHKRYYGRLTGAERINYLVKTANDVLGNRIRSAAIIDYYLKHINDERQLRELDMTVIRLIIEMALAKKFRPSDFKRISPAQLRRAGLVSMLHRNRLLRHGHIKTNFLSLYNRIVVDRYEQMLMRRKDRIDQIRLARRLKKK